MKENNQNLINRSNQANKETPQPKFFDQSAFEQAKMECKNINQRKTCLIKEQTISKLNQVMTISQSRNLQRHLGQSQTLGENKNGTENGREIEDIMNQEYPPFTTSTKSTTIKRNSHIEVKKPKSIGSYSQLSARTTTLQDDNTEESKHQSKLGSFITENNLKRLDKFKVLYQQGANKSLTSISTSQTRRTEKTPETTSKRMTMASKQDNSQSTCLFDGQKRRMLDYYSSRTSKPAVVLKKLGPTDSFDLCSPEQFKTIDVRTIEDSKHQKFEVTVNVPVKPFNQQIYKSPSLIESQSTQVNKKVLNQGKPPKPKGDQCQRRDQFETQSRASDTTMLKQHTQPIPFKLSRSNSRRSKEVLLSEKQEQERQQQEELERLTKDQQFKAKEIPKNHYVPELVVFRSTKNLTNFREFNFRSGYSTHRVVSQQNQKGQEEDIVSKETGSGSMSSRRAEQTVLPPSLMDSSFLNMLNEEIGIPNLRM